MNTTHTSEPTGPSEKKVAIQLGGEISLRDYFAANCGVSFQDAIDVLQSTGVNEPTGTQIIEMIACMRGGIADAMLAERAK